MGWSWKVGRLAGIEIELHWTFLILLAWVAAAGYQRMGTAAAAAGSVGFIVAIFASVLVHELGHALAARRYGVQTRGITLLPIGGVARLERMPDRPAQELVIALAGPAVTVAIVMLLFVSMRAIGVPVDPLQAPDDQRPFLARLMWINVALAVFNLLPAFPMDGGRVLRAALALRMDRVRATAIAAGIGKAFALVFGFVGLFVSGNFLLVVIALFIWIGAAGEAMSVQLHSVVRGVPVSRVMATEIKSLAPEQSLAAAANEVRIGFQGDFPVTRDHEVVGVLTRRALLEALERGAGDSPISDVMQRDFVTTQANDDVEDALARLASCGCRTLPVLSGRELVGLLTMEKIGEFVATDAAARRSVGMDGGKR